MAFDRLAAELPANQKPGLKIHINKHGFQHRVSSLIIEGPAVHYDEQGK